MNPAYIHIVVVHLPVVLSFILAYIGLKSLLSQKKEFYKSYFDYLSILMAATAAIAYFTGPSTADWLKSLPQTFDKEIIENHALWGRFAFMTAMLTGLLGLMNRVQKNEEGHPAKTLYFIQFILVIISLCLIMYTAHLGGAIRRPDLW